MSKKKIGLLCLALVLALGALGVGYASWTDTIFISGTVNTGSLDIVVENTSNTWVWKYPTDNISVVHTWDYYTPEPVNDPNPNGGPTPANGYQLIAWADADIDPTDASGDTVEINFGNIFPCKLSADILIHYVGTVPALVNAEITEPVSPSNDCLLLAQYTEFHFYHSDACGSYEPEDEILECPVQLHECNYVLCVMTLDIPQDLTGLVHPATGAPLTQDDFMGKSCSFDAEITATQWNECGD